MSLCWPVGFPAFMNTPPAVPNLTIRTHVHPRPGSRDEDEVGSLEDFGLDLARILEHCAPDPKSVVEAVGGWGVCCLRLCARGRGTPGPRTAGLEHRADLVLQTATEDRVFLQDQHATTLRKHSRSWIQTWIPDKSGSGVLFNPVRVDQTKWTLFTSIYRTTTNVGGAGGPDARLLR